MGANISTGTLEQSPTLEKSPYDNNASSFCVRSHASSAQCKQTVKKKSSNAIAYTWFGDGKGRGENEVREDYRV